MRKYFLFYIFLFFLNVLFSYEYPISSGHYIVYESGQWASFFGFTGDYASEFNYLNQVYFDKSSDFLNLTLFFDFRKNYKKLYYSSYIYSIFPYYLTDYLLIGQSKEDFNKKNLEFVYSNYDPNTGVNVKSKITFSNIYAQNFFNDLGILVFPNFNNKIFSFNKTFYYKFPVSNISFNILPSTNVKKNRKENEDYNNVTMFNVFYTFSNENPVSIISKSFNTKKVSLDAVRDQGIMINNNPKIFGLHNKIKTCFLYELDGYRKNRRYLPHIRQEVIIKKQKGRVIGLDILNLKVKVFLENDTIEIFPVADIEYENKREAPKDPELNFDEYHLDIEGNEVC